MADKVSGGPNPRKRILCVEDDDYTYLAVAYLLEFAGYAVTTVSTLAEGLELAEGSHFDLYLLDYRLPDGTGLELCRQIRAFDRRTPILFYSGLVSDSARQPALEAGAQDYLEKPSTCEALRQAISRLLGERAMM